MSDHTGPDSLEREFETPSWIFTPRQRGATPPPPAIPEQVRHDSATTVASAAMAGLDAVRETTAGLARAAEGPVEARRELVERAHWHGRRSGRSVMLVILSAAVAGTVISASRATMGQSGQAVGLLLVFAFLTILLYAVLTATHPIDVDLHGSRLTVRDADGVHRFDLTNPFQEVILSGTPDSPSWRLVLGLPDQSAITLRPRHVDPRVLHPVVVAARAYAERGRRERRERFNR